MQSIYHFKEKKPEKQITNTSFCSNVEIKLCCNSIFLVVIKHGLSDMSLPLIRCRELNTASLATQPGFSFFVFCFFYKTARRTRRQDVWCRRLPLITVSLGWGVLFSTYTVSAFSQLDLFFGYFFCISSRKHGVIQQFIILYKENHKTDVQCF